MTIYQHFRKHEHPFVDQVLSWKEQVERSYAPSLTDFLDPREQQIVRSIIGTTNELVQFEFFGGGDSTERKRAIIAPYYEEITKEDFDIQLLEASFQEKFVSIKHRDILGAFLSLGIDRKKIGDIIVVPNRLQLIITKELSTYTKLHLTKVNNTSISLKEKPFSEMLEKQETWVDSTHTVSSLRLDVLVKEIYQLSRKNALQLIQANRVKVNFTDVDDPAIQLMEGDLISVRGYGRSKLVRIDGKSRKNKTKIVTTRLKS